MPASAAAADCGAGILGAAAARTLRDELAFVVASVLSVSAVLAGAVGFVGVNGVPPDVAAASMACPIACLIAAPLLEVP